MSFTCILFIYLASILACRNGSKPAVSSTLERIDPIKTKELDYDTTKWTELTTANGYFVDIKYATTDNFVNEAVYPCGRCFLKPEAARKLNTIRDQLKNEGYGLKLFDCYRPRPVQYKLWEKVPNADYVAPPAEGSMHNRGVAVDLTLTGPSGDELNMGTPYDFFGPAAHHDYPDHPEKVLLLRQKLKSIMESNGFASIRTEWWHYSLSSGSYPLEDWQWPCDQ